VLFQGAFREGLAGCGGQIDWYDIFRRLAQAGMCLVQFSEHRPEALLEDQQVPMAKVRRRLSSSRKVVITGRMGDRGWGVA
jgi:hypothetical protein